ncbi:hypothetical protein [Bradyrhizobium sp. AS23.2]|uniref:hypothetical protein n=1 Tax=Bradyrhizobium sp. AS23.2 TaxID=1680155 RepID=UPI001160FD42|nr:hypothetical protein [Bradyrhizobium sp. AS23.2]
MSRKGHYNGGGTIIRSWDSSWFGKKVPKWAKRKQTDSAPKLPLSLAEKAALEAFKQERESGSKLIRKGENRPNKKRSGKPNSAKLKSAKPSPSVIKPSQSRPTPGLTEIHQSQRFGRSRKVTVEFASKGKREPG